MAPNKKYNILMYFCGRRETEGQGHTCMYWYMPKPEDSLRRHHEFFVCLFSVESGLGQVFYAGEYKHVPLCLAFLKDG